MTTGEPTPHPLYPDRTVLSVTIRGNTSPGWFSGQAGVWTGGPEPKIVGPFDSARDALMWQADNAPSAQVFPFYPPVLEDAEVQK